MTPPLSIAKYLEDGLSVVRQNPVPSLVAGVGMCVPIVGGLVLVNFLELVREARTGKDIAVGDLFRTDHVLDRLVAALLVGIGFGLFFVPGCFLLFAPCRLARRAGMPFTEALRGSLAYAKHRPVRMMALGLLTAVVASVGALVLGVGFFLTLPIAIAALESAYRDHESAVDRAESALEPRLRSLVS